MKCDIILAGVGGQGILSIAAIIGMAAIESGLHLKQAEVHGMSQRGGDVQSNLRISDQDIASDLIPKGKADMIISVEPMEALRYIPMLSFDGWLVTNTKPFINIPNYPEISDIIGEVEALPHHIAIDGDKVAHALGAAKSANMVILGAASPFLAIETSKLEDAIITLFAKKGEEVVMLNLNAFRAGRKFADEHS